jgi:hypothetical protein
MHHDVNLSRPSVDDDPLHRVGAKFEQKARASPQPIEALHSRRHHGCVRARPRGLRGDDAQGAVGQPAVEPPSLGLGAIKQGPYNVMLGREGLTDLGAAEDDRGDGPLVADANG